MPTRSVGRSWASRNLSDRLTSSSRFSDDIDPETSMTNVRATSFRSFFFMGGAWMATRTRCRSARKGEGAASRRTAKYPSGGTGSA